MQTDISEFFYKEETEALEYKEGFDKDDFAQTVAAFATHKGGTILIGVKNTGTPIGFRKPDKFDEQLQDIAKSVDGTASVSIESVQHTPDLSIVAVKVFEGDRKPYGWRGVFYLRKGKNDYKLTSEEIFRIKLKALNLTFDALGANIYGRPAHITDIDEKELVGFLDVLKTSKRQKIHDFKDSKQTLKNLDLICENGVQPKNAAILFFSKNLQQAFPSARINFLVYKGDEISEDYKVRQFIGGTLVDQLQQTFNLIRQYTENKVVIQELKRIEMTQYPMLAIREALINAIAHRDYSISNSEIVVRIFKNKIEITNPGGLMHGISLDELRKGGHYSKRRNAIVCQLFDDIGFMEQSGQGIQNMISQMKMMGLKEPSIEADEYSFKISFIGQQLDEKNLKPANIADLERVLNKRQKKALKYIQDSLDSEDGITATEYKTKFKVGLLTAMADLRRFEQIGLLKNAKIGRARRYFKKE